MVLRKYLIIFPYHRHKFLPSGWHPKSIVGSNAPLSVAGRDNYSKIIISLVDGIAIFFFFFRVESMDIPNHYPL